MNFVSSHQIFSVAMQQSHPSVSYSDDKKRSTGMTGEGGYLDDIIGALG
ncbi:hypothetical protein [Wolbachia endosymbiont (group A) of Tromatobia lineatoria]